jgi:hypothetical protein
LMELVFAANRAVAARAVATRNARPIRSVCFMKPS